MTGPSRLIGSVYTNDILITTLKAPNASNSSTYTAGSNNNVLLSNGTSIYWGTLAPSNLGLGATLTIGSYMFDGSEDVTIPVYNGSIS